MSFADAGIPVRVLEATPEAMARGMQRIRDNYCRPAQKRGSLAADEMEKRLARIHPVDTYEAIADADVVIEAVYAKKCRRRRRCSPNL